MLSNNRVYLSQQPVILYCVGTITDLSVASTEHSDKIATLEAELDAFKSEQVWSNLHHGVTEQNLPKSVLDQFCLRCAPAKHCFFGLNTVLFSMMWTYKLFQTLKTHSEIHNHVCNRLNKLVFNGSPPLKIKFSCSHLQSRNKRYAQQPRPYHYAAYQKNQCVCPAGPAGVLI